MMALLRRTPCRGAALVAAAVFCASGSALATEKDDVSRLEATVSAMEKTIEELKKEIQDLKARTKTLVSGDKVEDGAPSADRSGVIQHRDTVNQDDIPAPRPGNAPVTPDFPGFFRLFGTNTWARLGGYAKVDTIVDSTKLGNPNKFVTSSIPVKGDAAYNSDREFNIHAKQTRANLELRSPTKFGSFRVVYENDFFGNATGSDMSYNLRHFYGQVGDVTVGHTWSAFYDPDSQPDTLDSQGPGIQSPVRQPQLRVSYEPFVNQHIALSVEQPKSDIGTLPTDASDRNSAPDFAGFWRIERPRGHLQLSGLARALAYESATGSDETRFGWGLNVSGVLQTWGKDTTMARVTYGDGIGRYIQDLPSGSAAVADATGDLRTLSAWGMLVGYRHFWVDNLRSEVTYGFVDYDNNSVQGGTAYDQTHYAQANLVWSITPAVNAGLEYLYGRKSTRAGNDGDAHRGQFSIQYQLTR